MNVSLSIKEIVAGTATPSMLAVTYISLILAAGITLLLCSFMFKKESAVFRS